MITRKTVEYVLALSELKHKFPIGSTMVYQDKEWTVVGHGTPTPSTAFASFPFVIIEREDDK